MERRSSGATNSESLTNFEKEEQKVMNEINAEKDNQVKTTTAINQSNEYEKVVNNMKIT